MDSPTVVRPKLDLVILDCPDALVLARFYAPQQFHLDLSVPDLDAAEPVVLAAGARQHDHQPAEDGHLRVYLDPASHPFCLILG